jgi:hypothetical protein
MTGGCGLEVESCEAVSGRDISGLLFAPGDWVLVSAFDSARSGREAPASASGRDICWLDVAKTVKISEDLCKILVEKAIASSGGDE